MNPTLPSILALFARDRAIGFCQIEDGAICRYGVKTIRVKRRDPGFTQQVGKTLHPLIERIDMDCVVVIERRTTHPHKGQLTQVFSHIVESFISDIYPLWELSLDEVKMALCGRAGVTQRRLIERVVAMHPTFWSKVYGVSQDKARYWKKALMALALGLAALERLKTDAFVPER